MYIHYTHLFSRLYLYCLERKKKQKKVSIKYYFSNSFPIIISHYSHTAKQSSKTITTHNIQPPAPLYSTIPKTHLFFHHFERAELYLFFFGCWKYFDYWWCASQCGVAFFIVIVVFFFFFWTSSLKCHYTH